MVAKNQLKLETVKAAKDKRAAASKKAHSKRWLRQEYAAELAAAIEGNIEELAKDPHIINGACRNKADAVQGSALHQADEFYHMGLCRTRVSRLAASIVEEFQDELTQAVIDGLGAGAACSNVLGGCSSKRASLLLGSSYREDGMTATELDHLQVGYSDGWTIHRDVDDSEYWFSRSRMESVKEPPPGWVKTSTGWEFKGDSAADVTSTSGASMKDET